MRDNWARWVRVFEVWRTTSNSPSKREMICALGPASITSFRFLSFSQVQIPNISSSSSTDAIYDTNAMARRAAASGPAPSFSGGGPSHPSYGAFGAKRVHGPDADDSWFQTFVREQILAPQYLPGNLNIVASVALFAGGVFALRKWGDVLTLGI